MSDGWPFNRDYQHAADDATRVYDVAVLLQTALDLMEKWDLEPAVDALEEAMLPPLPPDTPCPRRPVDAELRWWAGVCCMRMGRGYQARGYWQAAAAQKHSVPIAVIFRGLAVQRLGGIQQAQGLLLSALEALSAEVEVTEGNPTGVGAPYLESPDSIVPTAAEMAGIARALALYGLGDRAAGQDQLEVLARRPDATPWPARYRSVVAAGLMQL